MEKQSSKQSGGWVTSLWDKYSTDIFFRTTCHIILLQIILTASIVTGLWFVTDHLVRETSETLISTFTQMLFGEGVTGAGVTEDLEEVRLEQFWPFMVVASSLIISFGFIMVYVALTPTRLSLERKKRFISNISHELRTPLAVMRTNTDVSLLDEQLPPKVRARLRRNIVEFERVTDIMNNLLGLSNLMQNQHLHFETVDLSKVAQRAVDSLSETINSKDITVQLKTHTQQSVLGNPSALEQIVFNLFKNAIAHIKSKGTITIEIDIASDGRYVNLSVSDTGSGISRNDLLHVFEPFYRARDSQKTGNKGQGLGLAIVNEIVQMHRGKIRIRSAVGKGTTVIVSIKCSQPVEGTTEPETLSDMEEVTMDFSRRLLQ